MDANELDRRMERERLFWVEVAPGKRLQFLRPLMDEARAFATDFGVAHVCQFLRGWDGVVESDLLKTGSTEPVDYEHRLASKALRDNIDWATKSATAMSEAMTARAKATAIVEKNSPPS